MKEKNVCGNLPIVSKINIEMKEKNVFGNLTIVSKMKKEHLNNEEKKRVWRPFRKIPNVRNLRIELSDYDLLFAQYEIDKRLKKAKIIYERFENRSLNRYLGHQLRRMERVIV